MVRRSPRLTLSIGRMEWYSGSVILEASSAIKRLAEYPRILASSLPGKLIIRLPFSSVSLSAVSDVAGIDRPRLR